MSVGPGPSQVMLLTAKKEAAVAFAAAAVLLVVCGPYFRDCALYNGSPPKANATGGIFFCVVQPHPTVTL